MAKRPLQMALIGGGGAGFIGKVHATAATLDRQAELVAGVLSSNPDRARAAADQFGIHPDRAYGSLAELVAGEQQRAEGDRVDFVSIATPNHTHCQLACEALEAGFHVVCDKPMTTNLDDADRMVVAAEQSGRVFALTHNYSGYPLIRQVREMIDAGDLGDLIAVRVSYVQGWMHGMDPEQTPQRGAWKSDPKLNGRAGSLGDVGTHAFHLAQFATGLTPQNLMCKMNSYSPHHDLDDYGHAMLGFDGGATGIVTWSQVTHGRLNDLEIEIDGTKAAVTWRQEEPNQLFVRSLGEPTRIYERNPNAGYSTVGAAAACRLPGGHPEAFFEAFANLYRDAITDMRKIDSGESIDRAASVYPSVYAGHDGVRFMARCLESQYSQSTWLSW